MTKKPPPQIHCQSTGVLWNRINVLIIYLPIIVNMYPIKWRDRGVFQPRANWPWNHPIIFFTKHGLQLSLAKRRRRRCSLGLSIVTHFYRPPPFPTSPNPLFVRICVLESLAIIYFVEYWEELPLSFTQKNDIYRRGRHLRILLYCWNKVYGRAHTAALVVMVQ